MHKVVFRPDFINTGRTFSTDQLARRIQVVGEETWINARLLQLVNHDDHVVTENYYYRVVSGVRGKIERLEHDLELLDEHHSALASELREVACGEDSADS